MKIGTQKGYASLQKASRIPFPAVVVSVIGVCIVLIGVLLITLRPSAPDFDSPSIFSQVPTGLPLKEVTALQFVDYVQAHGLAVADSKPVKLAPLKPSQAIAFNVQGQPAIALSYTDMTILLRDRSLLPVADDSGRMSSLSRNGSQTIAYPTAKPTSALSELWNMDSLGNVILLTNKAMAPALRSALVSHMGSLIAAPDRPNYPTATP